MAHVAAPVMSLAQHIFTLEPDKDAARLSFYQYLINVCEPNELVTADLINQFYFRALSFGHWQSNKVSLFRETESLLQHFQNSNGSSLDLEGLVRQRDLQIIATENLSDLEIVVRNNLEKTVTPGERIRVLRDGETRVISIALQVDQSVKVTTYPRAMILNHGTLSPIPSAMTLFYTPDLRLMPSVSQQIEVGPHASARFRSGPQGLVGLFVRGYTFQKYGLIEGGGLNRYPLLFYPLKRLEQFFIDRGTDPMYVDLIATAEQTIDLLAHSPTGENIRLAQAALERGRLALEHIFPDDSFVRLLINKLEKSLALLQVPSHSPQVQPTHEQTHRARDGALDAEPEGLDLLKDESWPEIRNLPV